MAAYCKLTPTSVFTIKGISRTFSATEGGEGVGSEEVDFVEDVET